MEPYTEKWNRRETVVNWMIHEADTIAISGHQNLDQDSLGSQVATYLILKNEFPEKEVILLVDGSSIETYNKYSSIFDCVHEDNSELASLECAHIKGAGISFDLFIGVDCASVDRLPEYSEEIARLSKNQLYFDHHPDPDNDKKFNVLNDPESASCTLVIYRFFKSRQYVIPDNAYDALYLGLVGDTGNFKYSNTDAHVFKLAHKFAAKMEHTPYEISQLVSSKTLNEINSLRDVYKRYQIDCHNKFIYYIHSYCDDIANGFSSTNNPVDVLTQLKDYEVALTAIKRMDGKYRVSIRTGEHYRADTFAARYGGGGHESAAGCACSREQLDALTEDIMHTINDDYCID